MALATDADNHSRWSRTQTQTHLDQIGLDLSYGTTMFTHSDSCNSFTDRIGGVRKRTWDKWVAKIREPNGGKKLWLGTFDNAVDAAFAYDEATRIMYVAFA
ncbi:dehydration-responsive element-binding protein 2d [Quercus suber]|uniref:Dehydration-responsive element-binding protein 2d n=1 Tax=Quercus suber TaxID=58331 RepID=A0AAW0ISB2_QUESU